MAKMTI